MLPDLLSDLGATIQSMGSDSSLPNLLVPCTARQAVNNIDNNDDDDNNINININSNSNDDDNNSNNDNNNTSSSLAVNKRLHLLAAAQ